MLTQVLVFEVGDDFAEVVLAEGGKNLLLVLAAHHNVTT